MEKKRVYLGLGSNLGDKKEIMTRAIELLSLALGSEPLCSSFIESEPWGFESQNSFVNCVVALETNIAPMQLLCITESIEKQLGREKKSIGGQYSDRAIDIDILFYGDEVITCERLTIPHPLLHKRSFVLEPLNEIAPQLMHPVLHRTTSELLAELASL